MVNLEKFHLKKATLENCRIQMIALCYSNSSLSSFVEYFHTRWWERRIV